MARFEYASSITPGKAHATWGAMQSDVKNHEDQKEYEKLK
jgi:hypothetical protein